MILDKGHYIEYVCNSCVAVTNGIKTTTFSWPKSSIDNNPLPIGWTRVKENPAFEYYKHYCEACSNIKDILE